MRGFRLVFGVLFRSFPLCIVLLGGGLFSSCVPSMNLPPDTNDLLGSTGSSAIIPSGTPSEKPIQTPIPSVTAQPSSGPPTSLPTPTASPSPMIPVPAITSVQFSRGILTVKGSSLQNVIGVSLVSTEPSGTTLTFNNIVVNASTITAQLVSNYIWATKTAFNLVVTEASGSVTPIPLTFSGLGGELNGLIFGTENGTIPATTLSSSTYQGISLTSSGAWIGTQSTSLSPVSGDLVFAISSAGTSTEIMRILANRNVGIRTPTPAGALDVFSNSIQALTVTGGYVKAKTIHASLTCSGAQSIPSGPNTYVIWDGVISDPYSMNNAGGDRTRITVPLAGRYRVGFGVNFPAANVGYGDGALIKNSGGNAGGVAIGGHWLTGPNAAFATHGKGLLSLNAGDYLQVVVQQTSGGPLAVCGTAWYNAGYFWVEYIGP